MQYPPRGRAVLLHPILYALIGDRPEHYHRRIRRLYGLLRIKRKLGGFETTDTDRISERAVEVLNSLDLVVVPSGWSRRVLIDSGVKAPIELLPHGVAHEFVRVGLSNLRPSLEALRKFKEESNAVLVLYNLAHSGYRKGADIVLEAMRRVQSECPEAVLVVKRANIGDDYLGSLKTLNTLEIAEFLKEWEYAQLYRLCDLVLVPSRGGGFEINALEGLASGTPTLVTDAGCFLDYVEYAIPIEIEGKIKILEGNPIHVGMGYQPSVKDLTDKILMVTSDLERWKKVFEARSGEVKERYSWKAIGERLVSILRKAGFM